MTLEAGTKLDGGGPGAAETDCFPTDMYLKARAALVFRAAALGFIG